jgi:DNA polymerase-1
MEAELGEIEVDMHGNKLTEKNGKTLLVDADTLVFAVCLSTEQTIELLPREFYTDEEWEEIENSPNYSDEEDTHTTIDLYLALQKSEDRLENMLLDTGCADWELHFTVGRGNFRYDIYPEYKANRKGGKVPAGLLGLKKKLLEKHGSDKVELHEAIEADDAVIAKYNKDIHILAAVDKDVLYSVEGTHWNYYSSSHYNIDPKWLVVTQDTANVHHFIQTLTGDKTDNIIGLHRVGQKTAEKLLLPYTTQEKCWEVVVDTYKSKGKTEEDALLTMRLVNMHMVTYNEGKYELKLWDAPRTLQGE